jgi:hypothetical protein
VEKRRQAAEDLRAARSRTDEPRQEEDTSVLDSLLDKLRKGEITRRAGHSRRDKRPSPAPLGLDIAQATSGDSAAAAALNMLAQLKSDGFSASDSAAALLSATSSSATPRKPRRRRGTDEQLALASPGRGGGRARRTRSGHDTIGTADLNLAVAVSVHNPLISLVESLAASLVVSVRTV